LRIAFATPAAARSAIARVSADLVRELVRRGHTVRVVATERDVAAPPRDDWAAPVIDWRAVEPGRFVADHDVMVAQVGDSYGFHGGLFPLFGLLPTVASFHDFYLYDLFAGWLWRNGTRPDDERAALHDATIGETYGPGLEADAFGARAGRLGWAEIAERFPMTEWIARRCDGAIAHAAFYKPRLLAGCPGPVGQAGLPVTGRGVPPLAPKAGGPVVLLTVGVMNPNKCVEQVIRALGASETLRDAVDYRLVGPIEADEQARLAGIATEVGYGRLSVHGAVDDDTLARHLAEADIMASLRKPVLEGASGSAIEALMAGRPLIVADAGFYGELPDDTVFKVPADVPEAALIAQLERLAADEPLRRRVGAEARAWAEATFTVGRYVDVLEAVVDETLAASPVLQAGRAVGRELSALGLRPGDASVQRIGAVMAALLAPD
jgi:glycosyltransferase involved in cell wall biosynthesis